MDFVWCGYSCWNTKFVLETAWMRSEPHQHYGMLSGQWLSLRGAWISLSPRSWKTKVHRMISLSADPIFLLRFSWNVVIQWKRSSNKANEIKRNASKNFSHSWRNKLFSRPPAVWPIAYLHVQIYIGLYIPEWITVKLILLTCYTLKNHQKRDIRCNLKTHNHVCARVVL